MELTMTAVEANKALVRRAIAYNHGSTEDATEIFSPEFVAYMPGEPPMDRVTFERYVAGTTVVFPGYTYEIHDQIARGDLVANRITWRGIHGGGLAGIAPTGRPLELRGINMFKVQDVAGPGRARFLVQGGACAVVSQPNMFGWPGRRMRRCRSPLMSGLHTQ